MEGNPYEANGSINQSLASMVDANETQLAESQVGINNMFGFITEGILLTTISTLGFIGNAMSVYVLLKGSVKGLFSNLLTGLASFDGLFLIMAILTFGLPTLSESYKSNVFLEIMPICYGCTHIFRVGSVYSTLSVTLERFFAIVLPFKDFDRGKKWMVPGTAIFAITYNIPRFFEVTTAVDPITNQTTIQGTSLRMNSYYLSYYVFWSKFILIELVPYLMIVIMNSFIIVKIVQSSRFRRKIMDNMNQQTPFKDVNSPLKIQSMSEEQIKFFENQRQEHKLGVLLIAISILFITCQSFKLIPDLFEVIFCHKVKTCYTTPFVNKIVDLSHLLVCINSSANFIIYLLGGEKFRKIWIETYIPRSCIKAMGCGELLRNNSRTHSVIHRSVHSTYRNKKLPDGPTNNQIRMKSIKNRVADDPKPGDCGEEAATFITISADSRGTSNFGGTSFDVPDRV